MAVTAMNRPDFRTIAEFRRRHLKALSDLFVQVLKLCQAAGLMKLGRVALGAADGRLASGAFDRVPHKSRAGLLAVFSATIAQRAADLHREGVVPLRLSKAARRR